MCRDLLNATHRTRKNMRGFSVVSAIFLLVILAALGALMLTFSSVQHTTQAQDIQGSRAYHAARTGIDWGLYQVLRNNAAYNCPTGSASSTTLASPSAKLGGTLGDFTVTVSCRRYPFVEGTNSAAIYELVSVALTGSAANPDRVERQLTVTVEYPAAQ